MLFYNLPHFLEHPLEIVQLWKGGMSFHGGFLGCVLAVVLFVTRFAYRTWPRPVAHLVTSPIVIAVVLLLFINLDHALPGTT